MRNLYDNEMDSFSNMYELSRFMDDDMDVDDMSHSSTIETPSSWNHDMLEQSVSSTCRNSTDTNEDMVLYRLIRSLFARGLLDTLKKYVEEIYNVDLALINSPYNLVNDKHEAILCALDDGTILITLTEFRIRVLKVIKRCLEDSVELNIVQLYTALRDKYQVIKSNEVPSIGSIAHSSGHCKPCVFACKKTNSCKSGFNCNFCHHHHKMVRRKAGKNWEKVSFENKLNSLLLEHNNATSACKSMWSNFTKPSPLDDTGKGKNPWMDSNYSGYNKISMDPAFLEMQMPLPMRCTLNIHDQFSKYMPDKSSLKSLHKTRDHDYVLDAFH
ncbi:hypothetical protein BdWA1_001481 [Babesia duncani]|uniref:C3H1-type domain-containing protein n=1 Tax=Babesia duncani TaxID=323732 RepID=A0AAD9ULY8_9APIC|nr:hypothetical protein BdWA1_004141 [Babesia duncani]KAK2198466.1 hypothetical protein BdWA1_001481 [Babesia duncani]